MYSACCKKSAGREMTVEQEKIAGNSRIRPTWGKSGEAGKSGAPGKAGDNEWTLFPHHVLSVF
jgi:hypothetical protein